MDDIAHMCHQHIDKTEPHWDRAPDVNGWFYEKGKGVL